MVFDINYILDLKIKYTKIELPDEFMLFMGDYVRKQNDLKKNQTNYNTQNTKASKPYKAHKQNKVQRIIIRNNNAWYPTTHSTAKNIINIIKANLNKLTTANFDTISTALISEILSTDINIIDLFCNEIISKNTYDKDFQDEYIKLCHRIWDLKLYKSFTEILYCSSNNKYYCKINTSTQSSDPTKYTYDYIGPYNSSDDIVSYLESEYSFKRTLLNRLYEIFKGRFNIYSSIADESKDEDVYKKKRAISSVVEFVCKLYLQDLISFNIIYLLHVELLTFQLEYVDYKKYDIEVLYTVWGIIKNIGRQKYNMDHINNIYNILRYVIDPAINALGMTPRIQFFIVNIQDIIRTKFRCVYNEQSVVQFGVLIDTRINSKAPGVNGVSSEDNNSASSSSSSSDSDSSSSDGDAEEEEEEAGVDVEDIIMDCLKNKGDLYKLIASNDIKEYVEVLVFITINDIKYLTNTVDVLCKLKVKKEDIVEYDKADLDEFAIDNARVYENYETFKSECIKKIDG